MAGREAEKQEGYLARKLLLAMPGLGDPRFHRAVIFICTHDETGAMGLVINHEHDEAGFPALLGQLGLPERLAAKAPALYVMKGGPVDPERGFLLHSPDFSRKETIALGEDYAITGTIEALKALAEGKGPEKALFILGYAGWTPGQLEEEIRRNSWLVAEPSPAVVFDGHHDSKWDRAVSGLGFHPAMLSGEGGRA